MKYFLLIATIFSITSSCSKDYSYEGQPLPQNIIEDEKEGLSFFLHTKGAEISVNIHQGTIWVPVRKYMHVRSRSCIMSEGVLSRKVMRERCF